MSPTDPMTPQRLREDADKIGFLAQISYVRDHSGELMAIRDRLRAHADHVEKQANLGDILERAHQYVRMHVDDGDSAKRLDAEIEKALR